jgi:RNA-binding protein 39
VFEPFGELELVQLQKEIEGSSRSRGHGIVQYREASAAKEALEKMNGFELAGRPIRVGLGNEKFTPQSTAAVLARFSEEEQQRRNSGDRERTGGGRPNGGARVGHLDDGDVAGVSFQNISRDALMKKLARDDKVEEKPT